VTGGVVLRIRLRFHNHAPQQLPSGLALHQQAADELGCNLLGGSGEEGLGEVLGELGGYGSGYGIGSIIQKSIINKTVGSSKSFHSSYPGLTARTPLGTSHNLLQKRILRQRTNESISWILP